MRKTIGAEMDVPMSLPRDRCAHRTMIVQIALGQVDKMADLSKLHMNTVVLFLVDSALLCRPAIIQSVVAMWLWNCLCGRHRMKHSCQYHTTEDKTKLFIEFITLGGLHPQILWA